MDPMGNHPNLGFRACITVVKVTPSGASCCDRSSPIHRAISGAALSLWTSARVGGAEL